MQIREKLVAWSTRRIKKLYGEFDVEMQYPFYRCSDCYRVVTWKHITSGSGCFCGSGRMSPTNLSVWEEIRILFMPWSYKIHSDINATTVYKRPEDAG